MKKKNKRIIGIDIGGTKMRAVLWNGKKVLKTLELRTPGNLAGFKSALIKLIKFLGKTDKVAVGTAGAISKNKLKESANIPYIKNFYFFDVLLDNDARCFGRAEYEMGSAAGEKTAFFITLGTGIGRAVGKNGKILRIKRFEYPEPWEPEYQKLRRFRGNKKLAEYLSGKLTKLTKPYRPQAIIIGGGISTRPGFLAELKRISGLPLKKPKFGKNAVAIGAAALF